jgi:hypothetical protein
MRVLLLFVVCASLSFAAEPVPPAPEVQKAEAQLKDTFKEDYRKIKPEERDALAQKLYEVARDEQKPAAQRYAGYKEALNLAGAAGNGELALEIIDRWNETFGVDEKPLVRTAMASSAMNCRDTFRSRAYNARKTLVDTPDDPAANQVYGEYVCFALGEYERGMTFLWKSSEAGYKAVAPRELVQPTEVDKQVELADAWWSMSEKERVEQRKQGMQARAVFWYSAAQPNLNGIDKIKAEKRVADGAAAVKALEKIARRPANSPHYLVFKNPQSSLELTGSQAVLSQGFRHRTVECWIQVLGDAEGYIYKDGGGANQMSVGVMKGELMYGILLGGKLRPITCKLPPKNTWVHLAIQFDAGKMEFWVNGMKVSEADSGTRDMPGHPGSSGVILAGNNIGVDTGWGLQGFAGAIHSLRISKTAKYTAQFKPGPLAPDDDTLAFLDLSKIKPGPITDPVSDQVYKASTWTVKGEVEVQGR